MTMPNLAARRATIEDLQKLTPLWSGAGLNADELGRRFQEFQVVEGGGEILAAIGMQIDGQQARLHHEACAQPDQAEALRAKLWERIQTVSKNHGFARIWTQLDSPFWSQNGFQNAPPEVVEKLPPAFAGQAGPWSCLQLRGDAALPPSIEKEFAMFKEMQQAEREDLFRRAKVMKTIALLAVLAVFILVAVLVVIWMAKRQALHR